MSFFNLLHSKNICIDDTSQSKTAVLLKISYLLCENNPKLDIDALFDAFWKRESLGSTAIGHGILIPHIRSNNITSAQACFIKLKTPVHFNTEDKQPIDLVIGLVVPQEETAQHLQLLQDICSEFANPVLRKACRSAENQDEMVQLLIPSRQNATAEII